MLLSASGSPMSLVLAVRGQQCTLSWSSSARRCLLGLCAWPWY
uniref:Uncharacterized protein n=1 Tax=Arundo donax TaxID=35708 RepID=A0A0A9GHE4_ARUDO